MKSGSATRIGAQLAAARSRRWALIAFVAIVAVTGGGSRADILSLVILRPLAVMFAAYAILAAPRGAVAEMRTALWLIGLAAFLIVLHLVPLPPSLWHALAGREAIENLDAVLGLPDVWRPLAISPSGAWNALFSLAVPTAAILLYAALDRADREIPFSIWVTVAFGSAALGIAQMLGNPQGPLYAYAVTNAGAPVGLLANANHQSVLLAIAIPLAVAWANRRIATRSAAAITGATGAFVLLSVALLTGSRAGALAAVAGTIVAIALIIHDPTGSHLRKTKPRGAGIVGIFERHRRLATAALALLAAGLIALVLAFSPQGIGYSALVAGAPQDELRLAALPTILDLFGEVWVAGVGAGSFAEAFGMVEPVSLLQSAYLNHAHNDWIEVPVEYGLPGIALLLMLMIYTAGCIRRGWSEAGSGRALRVAMVAPPVVLAAASLVDYPLRVPLVQVLTVLWLLALGTGALPDGLSRNRRG